MEDLYGTEDELIAATARVIYMPAGQVGEQLAIAIIGTLEDAKPFSRAVTSKLLRCLPEDLGHACLNFGSIVAADFIDFVSSGRPADEWQVPLAGLVKGEPLYAEGYSLDSIMDSLARLCALSGESSRDGVDIEDREPPAPRVSEEARFLEGVKEEVTRRRPRLKSGFKRVFSLTGGHVANEIDFVGHRYATCYAALNPKSRQAARVMTASAALWRLARARDAFGFAAPATMELTAWVPPAGLPLFSAGEYGLVREMIAELKAQAAREELGVSTATSSLEAATRLIELEGNSAPA